MRWLGLYIELFFTIFYFSAEARIINIPVDYPTIQIGINSSIDGDTVLVAHGTYFENLNFNGHNIVLASRFLIDRRAIHIDSTTIDGNNGGPVIQIHTNEDASAAVIGFSIQHGRFYAGGGIYCSGASPTISYNLITENIADDWEVQSMGGGVYLRNSNSYINKNIFKNNMSVGSYGAYGGGAFIDNSNPVLINDLFIYNQAHYGGGLMCDGASTLYLKNSILWGNGAVRNGNQMLLDDLVWPQISYCDIADTLFPGEGNISVNPMFRDSLADFHLISTECKNMANSPLIDSGDPSVIDDSLACSWGLGTIRSDIGAFGGGRWEPIGINNDSEIMPNKFLLSQNHPNPFNAQTSIRYFLPTQSHVTIDVYDIQGRKVETFEEGIKPAGSYQIIWYASDLASGTYFYRIKAGEFSRAKKMVLLK